LNVSPSIPAAARDAADTFKKALLSINKFYLGWTKIIKE
jgi:hypothetical protein